MVPAVIYFVQERRHIPVNAARGLMLGLNSFNIILGLFALGAAVVWLFSPSTAMAATGMQEAVAADPYVSLAAALAVGTATIGAGIAVQSTGAAAVGAIAEKPDTFGRALIFVGLAEGIAIYGLIIAFMILNR
ncbi:MAG: H+transporting two-sector ATPase C subunit [Anaerolineae bacterium]|nr:H+transporting two-sector ATPase C subunit [Anaerolineae bacterium]